MAAVMMQVMGKLRGLLLVAAPMLIAVAGACSSAGRPDAAPPTTAPTQDFVAQSVDFVNLHNMTTVRGFFVDNRLGHLDEAVAVANNPDGGVYPVGTVIQLVPQEAMVKRAAGFDPATNDWEFFSLDVSVQGTTILTRGGAEVINRFGGNSCADCHQKAEPKWDFVCEQDHGCEPLPIGDDVIAAIQRADPRPASPPAA
jgi:hypothetical protein